MNRSSYERRNLNSGASAATTPTARLKSGAIWLMEVAASSARRDFRPAAGRALRAPTPKIDCKYIVPL